MRAHTDILKDAAVGLNRQDLIEFEHALKDAIAEHVPFTDYSLFFPDSLPGGSLPSEGPLAAEFRRADGELILPLALGGELLGYFLARGVRLKAPATAPGYLMALATAQLEKLLLYKRAVTDPLTGLYTRDYFLAQLRQEIALVQHGILPDQSPGGGEPSAYTGNHGVILLDLDGFQRINERYGYIKGDAVLAEAGRVLRLVSPRHVTSARFQNDRYAMLVPDASPRACFQLAEVLRTAIRKLRFEDDVTGDRISVTASVGYAAYPQALSGPQHAQPPEEQARILVRKAAQAVATAKLHGRDRVFHYADILAKGGKVLERLPMQRFSVSLGATVGAREGQRFLVAAPRSGAKAQASLSEDERLEGRYPAMYTAELALVEVQDTMAFAELLHQADPDAAVQPGDTLVLAGDGESFFDNGDGEGMDDTTGLLGYRGFLAEWTRRRQDDESFCLALVQLLDPPRDRAGSFRRYMDAQARTVVRLMERYFGEDLLGGRFGLGGMLFHLPGAEPKKALFTAESLAREAAEREDLPLAIGLARHPYLSFAKEDALDNSRKALEHAKLLPAPHAALLDSVSLNIAADQLSMEGDLHAAMEEYKLALLADEANVLARISLGVCLAQLKRFSAAATQFRTALRNEPDNRMALYNLGWILQRQGELAEARKLYNRCLRLDPDDVFSLVRLGSLAEAEGKPKQARKHYRRAAQLPGGEPLAMRHLARVHLALGEAAEARECLHLALNANHNDAQAMHLLATLYLDTGEDPQIAEVLARQSAALMPGRDDYWDTLVRALEAQGKDEEARRASLRKTG